MLKNELTFLVFTHRVAMFFIFPYVGMSDHPFDILKQYTLFGTITDISFILSSLFKSTDSLRNLNRDKTHFWSH